MRQGKSCSITKTCYICQKERHNTLFYQKDGRTRLETYCKYCRFMHKGIKNGFVPLEKVQGMDFNWDRLQSNDAGWLVMIENNKVMNKIDLNTAIEYVKQGGAYVLSENIISQIPYLTDGISMRHYIRQRDKYCYYCGCENPRTMDHIKPKSKGGLSTILNLAMSCHTCNLLKGDISEYTFRYRNKHPDQMHQTPLNQLRCQGCGTVGEKLTGHLCSYCDKFRYSYQKGFISKSQLEQIRQNETYLNRKKQRENSGEVAGKVLYDGHYYNVSYREIFRLNKYGIISYDQTNECFYINCHTSDVHLVTDNRHTALSLKNELINHYSDNSSKPKKQKKEKVYVYFFNKHTNLTKKLCKVDHQHAVDIYKCPNSTFNYDLNAIMYRSRDKEDIKDFLSNHFLPKNKTKLNGNIVDEKNRQDILNDILEGKKFKLDSVGKLRYIA